MLNIDGSRSVALQTRRGNDIANVQDLEVPRHRREATESLIRQQLGLDFTQVTSRRESTATYNCHGMTFASRRTGIYEVAAVELIMTDDGYREIDAQQAMPGDVVLYFEPEGLAHSGLVVAVDRLGAATVPIVLSKWGIAGEYVHTVWRCPYPRASETRYYREGHDGP
jgi:hypothetical protein